MAIYNTISGLDARKKTAKTEKLMSDINKDVNQGQIEIQSKLNQLDAKLDKISSGNEVIKEEMFLPAGSKTSIDNATTELKVFSDKLQQDVDKLNADSIEEKLKVYHTLYKKCSNDCNTALDKFKDILDKIDGGGSGGGYSNNFTSFKDDISNFLSNLTLEQTVIIVNITGCICIIISLISLFTIFYGNILIDKLNLDTRFPRVGKLIN